MVKIVIMNLDLSKACRPDCIPVAVLKKCELVLQFVGRFHRWSLYLIMLGERLFLIMLGERSRAKKYRSISLLSVVNKVYEKPVNNRIVDYLEECDLFLISSMVLGLSTNCRSSHSCI